MNIKNFLKSTITTFSCILFISTLLIFPSEIFFATKTGLLLWYNNILPSVFAFIIGINIISAIDLKKQSAQNFDTVTKKSSFFPPAMLKSILLGHLSGYPLGGKLTISAYKNKTIETSYLDLMLASCCACSPVFLISAIGVNIFNDKLIGYVLIISQFLANILLYIYFHKKIKSSENKFSNSILLKKKNKYIDDKLSINSHTIIQTPNDNMPIPFYKIISDSIINAIETVINICGTIVFFCIIIKILQIYKIDQISFNLINNISNYLLNYDIEGYRSIFNTFLYGLLEITNGIYYLSSSPATEITKLCIISFLTTIGGLCVFMQIFSILSQSELFAKKIKPIHVGFYLKFKIIAAIISSLITYIILKLFLF